MRVTHHERAAVNVIRNHKNSPHSKSGSNGTKKGNAKKAKGGASHSGGGFFSFLKSEGMVKVYGIILLAFSVLLLVSLVSFLFTAKADIAHIANPELPPHNWARTYGAHIANFFTANTFGLGSLGFIYIFSIAGLCLVGFDKIRFVPSTISALLTMAWISFVFGFFCHNTAYEYLAGAFGLFTAQGLLLSTGKFISILVALSSALIIGALCYRLSIKELFLTIGGGAAAAGNVIASAVKSGNQKLSEDIANKRNAKRAANTRKSDQEYAASVEETVPYINDLNGLNSGINNSSSIDFTPTPQEPLYTQTEPTFPSIPDDAFAPIDMSAPAPWDVKELQSEPQSTEKQPISKDKKSSLNDKPVDFEIITQPQPENIEASEEDIENEEVTEIHKSLTPDEVRALEPYDPKKDLEMYQFPPLDLLDPHTNASISPESQRKELTDTKLRIENTLKSFGIGITKISAIIGPTVTLYEIVPEEGVRINKIKSLEDDIALSLSALGIRIIAPIPGKGTIGIEVPNKTPSIVSMREIIASDKFKNNKYDLPIGLGKTISNEPFICDLAKMPHLLMAGATGQGKSVGLNAVITSLLYSKHPAELKFVLVDPKKLEFSLYSTIEKHYLAKLPDEKDAIIIDTKKVIRTLNSLCIEMDTRYDLLKAAKVRNIKEYNAKFCHRELSPTNGHRYLPYIVVIIDEFGDLIMTAGREVETPIARLAQLARACGIHLIIATQRPTTKIISGNIKGNFPARIAFRVVARIDSQVILDSTGADQLVGKGDMLLSTGSDLLRLQCAFVDTPEVEAITNFISDQQSYEEAFQLPEYADEQEDMNNDSENLDNGKLDPCFMDAAKLIVQSQQGSTSLIQRKMSLGYNRAGRIMDQMEQFGIVGPQNGSKAREVKVMTEEDLKVIFARMGLI